MIAESICPCELIVKIGSNEYEDISNAFISLLRLCSIDNEKFLIIEQQIHPTNYFSSFTNSSTLSMPIQCQSLSCVIFLSNEFFEKDFFKSFHLWKFHHKIELLNEYQKILARQDYYELSQFLPLWSITHISLNKQIIVRFNIFTNNFQVMLKFYENLFQRKPDSSKTGFILYYLSSNKHAKIIYQFSLKSSPSIHSYTISQNACLKFHLNHLNHILHQYSSKLFTINPLEYYIYDPDGNLLHLCLHQDSKIISQINDSGFVDSSHSDLSMIPFLHPNFSKIISPIDNQSYSSNDSGQCTSITSNEFQIFQTRLMNQISVRSAKQSEIDDRLKYQQKLALKRSLYESEPRLSHSKTRFYSSMNYIRPISIKTNENNDSEISYEVDSPRSISNSYLQRFLMEKQQNSQSTNVKQLITQFENHHIRPKSAPLMISSSKSIHHPINDQTLNSKINIGITLDSRLRKTPVLDMLRSTMMESPRSNTNFSFPSIARF